MEKETHFLSDRGEGLLRPYYKEMFEFLVLKNGGLSDSYHRIIDG